MDKSYFFKLSDVNSNFSSPTIEFKVSPINFLKELDEKIVSFIASYNNVVLPSSISSILEDFLIKADLLHLQHQFATLVCACQGTYELYADNQEIIDNELYKEIEGESKEVALLLNALQIHLNGEQQIGRTIKFGFSEETIKIKNRWVIQDIYDILILHYKLQVENFETKKVEIVEKHKNFDAKKGGEFIKSNIINCFYNFLSSNMSSNQRLKIIGSFLRICQIPTGSAEPLLFEDIQVTLDDIEVSNLRHFIKRPVKFHK